MRGCAPYEEAISALLDHEDPGLGEELLGAHLSQCRACERFAAAAVDLDRRVRVRVAEVVPDSCGRILAAVLEAGSPRRARQRGALVGVWRPLVALLGMVGVVAS
jgi:predicted anti-sigma-YlaC factor YlaD